MSIEISHIWVLLALPLCVIPLLVRDVPALSFSSLVLLPPDRLSSIFATALRFMRSTILGLLLLGLSGPYLAERSVERIGEGAQIILLLDRSRSMDQPFGGHAFGNPIITENAESKGTVARRLLADFVGTRRNDKYGMLVFSTEPIQVLPFTDKTRLIQAAISAGNIGRGLSETDIGAGITEAIRFFDGQPYTGSRVVMLVSDGGARLDKATRIYIADMLRRYRVALYWVYIRSRNSPGIIAASGDDMREDIAPARVLHEYFETLETPYRAFDAEDPSALAAAITQVNELQSLPIRYVDVIPRKDIANRFYVPAIGLILILLLVEQLTIKRW